MSLPAAVELAVKAALDKKAEDAVLLDLRRAAAFTDYFLLLSGGNPKQLVAIADAVQDTLKAEGRRPDHVEGYPRQEWILLDYGTFVVHIFSRRTRDFYDLERLWGAATRVELAG
ncbi:MAG TPA: ribosome silencing factor [Vicinamibacteria bacterium]